MIPSDDDLNCLLKEWAVPRSPDSLEGRLRRAYRDRERPREVSSVLSGGAAGWQRTRSLRARARWIAGFLPSAGKFAGVLAGAVVLLAVITRAFPQSLSLIAPPGAMIIESEFLNYTDGGSSTVSEYRTSSLTVTSSFYGETTLSSSFPGDPLRTAAVEVFSPVEAIMGPIMHDAFDPLFYKPGRARYMRALESAMAARIRNGCTPTNHWGTPMTVIGKETVLDYTTTVSRYEFKEERFTEWFAPELDCFSLRSTTEKTLPDGAFRLASERRVLKITRNSSKPAAKGSNQ
jgi:hypothetical protein